jgi:hypothetical protein
MGTTEGLPHVDAYRTRQLSAMETNQRAPQRIDQAARRCAISWTMRGPGDRRAGAGVAGLTAAPLFPSGYLVRVRTRAAPRGGRCAQLSPNATYPSPVRCADRLPRRCGRAVVLKDAATLRELHACPPAKAEALASPYLVAPPRRLQAPDGVFERPETISSPARARRFNTTRNLRGQITGNHRSRRFSVDRHGVWSSIRDRGLARAPIGQSRFRGWRGALVRPTVSQEASRRSAPLVA